MIHKNQTGMVLVLVLVLVALLVSIVGEFVYEVYTSSAQLRAWQQVKAMGVLSYSVVDAGKDLFAQKVSSMSYTYPAEISLPLPIEDASATITVRDLQDRINLNALVYQNGTDNARLMGVCRRLLEDLNIDTGVIDRIADWIDPDVEPRLPDSEQGAKNGPLITYEELYYIKGIKKEFIDKMREFFTVYPDRSSLSEKININTASKEVLIAMAEGITEAMASEAIASRQNAPFERCSDIKNIPGFESVYPDLSALCTVKSSFFVVEARAQKGDITSLVQEVVRVESTGTRVLLYREY